MNSALEKLGKLLKPQGFYDQIISDLRANGLELLAQVVINSEECQHKYVSADKGYCQVTNLFFHVPDRAFIVMVRFDEFLRLDSLDPYEFVVNTQWWMSMDLPKMFAGRVGQLEDELDAFKARAWVQDKVEAYSYVTLRVVGIDDSQGTNPVIDFMYLLSLTGDRRFHGVVPISLLIASVTNRVQRYLAQAKFESLSVYDFAPAEFEDCDQLFWKRFGRGRLGKVAAVVRSLPPLP